MNHTGVVTEAPRALPHRRAGAWVLSRTQMGLLLGCVGVGLILALGAGFIAGMWYQTSAQITPSAEPQPVVAEQPPRVDSQDLTFYSTLTSPGTPAVSPAPPEGSKAVRRLAGSGPQPSSVAAPKASERLYEPGGSTPGAGTGRVVDGPRQEAVSKPPTPAGGYRVQVGSFQSRRQAESLRQRLAQQGYRVSMQPTTLPDKGVWYRVQVGGVMNRGAAERLVQHLAARQRVVGVVVDGTR